MPKYYKIHTDSRESYICINDNDAIMVDKVYEEYPKRTITVGYNELCKNILQLHNKTEIKETVFLNAIGDVQAAIQNFIDKTRIG